jgi:hypothetical protein
MDELANFYRFQEDSIWIYLKLYAQIKEMFEKLINNKIISSKI